MHSSVWKVHIASDVPCTLSCFSLAHLQKLRGLCTEQLNETCSQTNGLQTRKSFLWRGKKNTVKLQQKYAVSMAEEKKMRHRNKREFKEIKFLIWRNISDLKHHHSEKLYQNRLVLHFHDFNILRQIYISQLFIYPANQVILHVNGLEH